LAKWIARQPLTQLAELRLGAIRISRPLTQAWITDPPPVPA
jgi:hypothetical protein